MENNPSEQTQCARRDNPSRIIWAAVLIWAGLVFLANNLNMLDQLIFPAARWLPVELQVVNPGVWMVILTGAGVLLLVECGLRLVVPAWRRPIFGTLILAMVFIGAGLGAVFNINIIWPLILIAIGASFLLRGFGK